MENDYLRDRVECVLAGHRAPARVVGEVSGRYIILTLSRPVPDTSALVDDVVRATGAHTVEILTLGGAAALVLMWQDAQTVERVDEPLPIVAAGPRRWIVGGSHPPVTYRDDVIIIGGE